MLIDLFFNSQSLSVTNPDPETLSFSRLGLLGTLSVLEDDVGTRGVKPLHVPAICHHYGLGHSV